MKKKTIVISIAAVSGGGKTAITKQVMKELRNCNVLHFDDYEFHDSPNDICKWIDDGADYNEWRLTPLIADVKSLLTESLDYILLDYPFAYLNEEMREYIDLTIYIDTPLDIAMARRIVRDFSTSSIADVQADMKTYLSRGREAYLEMICTVKPNSDIVIDGSLPVRMIVDQIVGEIEKRKM